MKETTIKQALMEDKLVAIFRGVPTGKAAAVARALLAGGIRFFEICLDQTRADAWEAFQEQVCAVKEAVGGQGYVGAGTVLTLEDLEMAAKAGCQLIVSPCTDEAMIRRTKELGLISIPGAMTPTEVNRAYLAGADLVKMYVVEDLWDSLSEAQRAELTSLIVTAVDANDAEIGNKEAEILADCEASGIRIQSPDRAPFREAAREYYLNSSDAAYWDMDLYDQIQEMGKNY